ncbi:MAG: ATP-binding protein [Bacteroidota bacterium]
MNNLKKNFIHPLIQKKSLILIFIFTGIIIISSAVIELQQSKEELLNLMESQSHSLLESMSQASENAIIASQQIEEEIKNRLLNNCYYIKTLYEKNLLTKSSLKDFADNNNLYRVNVFDRSGQKIFSSHETVHYNLQEKIPPADILQPIFSGENDTLIIGIKGARFEEGYRYAVALSAKNRCAVVCNIDAAEILSLRKEIGFGSLVNKIINNPNIIYVAIQDTSSVLAASSNVDTLEEIQSSSFLNKSMQDSLFQWRIAKFSNDDVFEAVHPFTYQNKNIGLLRLGLSLSPLNTINDKIIRRIIIIGIILFILGSIVFALIFINQNFNLLKKEYHSIELFANRVIEKVNDGIIVLDPANNIKLVNESAVRLFQKSKEEILNKDLCSLISPDKCKEIIETDFSLQQIDITIDNRDKNLLVSKSRFDDAAGKLNTVFVLSDFTEQRLLENQIERNERLAAIGGLASTIAHEIRNPLNSIGTITQQLGKDYMPSDNREDYQNLTKLVYKEVRRINDIIENFLNFARPLPINPSNFRLTDFFYEIEKQYSAITNGRNIKLQIDNNCACDVFWDRTQMHQVMLNLIENAIDAVKTGGLVSIKCYETKNEKISIEVSDDGKGIQPENLKKIFNLYFTTKPDGNGIGLSIVQKIITEHDGMIDVISKEGSGTKFTIMLPKKLLQGT